MARMTSAIAAAFAAAFLTQPASSQPEQKLGTVNFETSCTPEAQKLFDRGDAVPALVLVPRVAKGIRGRA